jgi:flagellar biosynthetic protein FlhB
VPKELDKGGVTDAEAEQEAAEALAGDNTDKGAAA